jgi:ABC-type nitrate/sulfonate/bicarbonate transport system substrate-binding protein
MRKALIGVAMVALVAGAAQAQQLEKVTFTTHFEPDGGFTNLTAITDHGFGKAEGLDVNLISPGSASDSVKLLASGTAQFGIVNSTAVIIARSQGVPIVSIIAPNQIGTAGVMVPAESGIHTVKELEGKTIGITGIPANRVMLEAMLRANGVDLGKTRIVEVGFGDTAVLLAGKIDAIGDAIPFAEPVEFNQARGKPLNDTSTYVFFPFYKYGGPSYYTFNIDVTEDYLATHSDTVKKFSKAWRDATEWSMANPEDAARLYVKHYPELKYDRVVAEWKLVATLIRSPDTDAHGIGWQNPDIWAKLARFMYDNKLVKNEVDASKAFTNADLPGK